MAEYSPYKNKFPQATREGLVEFKIPEKKKGKGKREKPLRNEHKNIKPQREEANTPQLENKPYNSAYLQNINSALKNIPAPKPFEYDYTTDALYKQYKKEYERNADLAAHVQAQRLEFFLIENLVLNIETQDDLDFLAQLPQLQGCQVHSTVMLSEVDRKIFKKLGCGVTCDPVRKK